MQLKIQPKNCLCGKEDKNMKRKVIIDCDPGIDDSLALMLALSMEELEVAGITIVCGNAPVDMGFENAKKVLNQMGRLDVTRKIVLTPDLLEYIQRLNPKMGDFIRAITKFYFDFHWQQEHLIGCVINDPLAVAYFADRTLCSGIEAFTQVETEGISIGQTVVDGMNFYRERANAVVLTSVDELRFFRLFLSKILQRNPNELDLIPELIRKEA